MTGTDAVQKRRVLLVDDQPLFRNALALILQAEPNLEVGASVGTAHEALSVAIGRPFDLAIVDVLMTTGSGIMLCSELLEARSASELLILSSVDEPKLIADLLRGGATGVAIKSQPPSEIVEAVRCVLDGMLYVAPTISREAIDAELATPTVSTLASLTRRERDVFELLIRGNSNDEIASRLFISRRTAETHRQRVMNKLCAHSIVQMQRIAARFWPPNAELEQQN